MSLPPKAQVNFEVTFRSRITNPPQQATISFTHRNAEGSALAAALVFKLISDVKAPHTVPGI